MVEALGCQTVLTWDTIISMPTKLAVGQICKIVVFLWGYLGCGVSTSQVATAVARQVLTLMRCPKPDVVGRRS